MIMDGSKEQILGDFARKLRDAGCHRKQIEPQSTWMNLCEGEIRELKRGLTRKMLKRNVPKSDTTEQRQQSLLQRNEVYDM